MGGFSTEVYFLTVLEPGRLGVRSQQGWLLLRFLFLARRRLSSCCVLPWRKERERESSGMPPSPYKDRSSTGSRLCPDDLI